MSWNKSLYSPDFGYIVAGCPPLSDSRRSRDAIVLLRVDGHIVARCQGEVNFILSAGEGKERGKDFGDGYLFTGCEYKDLGLGRQTDSEINHIRD